MNNMKRLQSSLRKANAWQIRIVALAFIVLSVAGGSHALVSAFAADADVQTNYVSSTTVITVPMHESNTQLHVLHITSKGYQPVGSSHP